jgi:hypothetical protein
MASDLIGSAFVVYGKKSGFSNVDTSTFAFDPTNGISIKDSTNAIKNLGYSVSTIGDMNGDGLGDFVIGNPGSAASLLDVNVGKSYVVFGQKKGFDLDDNSVTESSIDVSLLATADGDGFTFTGEAVGLYDNASGSSVGSAGDINGDGYDDMIIATPFFGASAFGAGDATGISYVVYGDATPGDIAINPSQLDGTKGFTVIGAAGDYLGRSVNSLGDINGDGFGDLGFGADYASLTAGTAYVVFGKSASFGATDIDVSTFTSTATNGFKITNSTAAIGNQLGFSIKTAGDVNGDGYDDFLVGETGSGTNEGAAYVVFGKTGSFGTTVDVATLDGSNGFKISGTTGETDKLGNAVSAAGDVNGDGFDDIVVGASAADLEETLPPGPTANEGEAYVIFGSDHFGHKVTHLGTDPGKAKIDVLTGNASANTFVAGLGNDVANGRGGADVFNMGAGNDVIRVSDLNFRLVDGGGGRDTLSLATANKTLNLSLENISNIETIDITGTGVNTLKLTALDVLNMSENGNQLNIRGNIGDKIDFDDTGWTDAGRAGAFDKYTNGEAVVLVGQAITVVDLA